MLKKIVPVIYILNEIAYEDEACKVPVNKELSVVDIALGLEACGADELLIVDKSFDDATHDGNISTIRLISKAVDIPLNISGNIKRVEDVKKYLYAGGRRAVLDASKESNLAMMTEVSNRFGAEKIGVYVKGDSFDTEVADLCADNKIKDFFYGIDAGLNTSSNYYTVKADLKLDGNVLKEEIASKGFEVVTFTSSMNFDEFKLDSAGLIPVIVQDYKTDQVLMMAYMNKEAFENTLKTGRMTYYSRSRKEQWVKGETSGHYQYVKSLDIDCDKDTILAKVLQVGAACHTGNYSCFYRNLAKKDYVETNPLKVFNDVMAVINDRKIHPKEGSYTNYLFDKGIDKILKKCGEEATEIIIAAKNPDSEEIIYEISDFLYHVMVLMSLKEVTWEEIIGELAKR